MTKTHTVRKFISLCLCICMLFSQTGTVSAQEPDPDEVHIDLLDYGADPTGIEDSTVAVQKALEAAKEAEENGTKNVVLDIPNGEYHIYKDHAWQREYHTSNTNSIENPVKTIGILIEEHENLTVNGNGSLFMMHGNMMALAVVDSKNVTLKDFSWDFGVPTVSEMTIVGLGTENGAQYTDFYIPPCFPYEISGNTIRWLSEKSPYTGEYYWTQTGVHSPSYAVVVHFPDDEMTRNYGMDASPFNNVSSIRTLEDGIVRIMYNSSRPSMYKMGTLLELNGNAHRETAGAFTWESENVLAEGVNVHFMHGFGWLIQMSKDVIYRNCNFMPRENSGHKTVSFADVIHASGAAGEITVEGCNFSNSHDDPINIHGTFTRVEQRVDDNTLVLKYIHNQQGGFPQYHVGDKVQFFTRDTLESTDSETQYTVAEVVSDPGEDGNDLRTMKIRFEETLPANLSDMVSGQPKYVAENVTYAPAVTIRNNTFKNVPTRGILCTTRKKVVIEDNTFLNMSMATIYLSNDSDNWYESGPIRDMTIKNNTFYIKSIGDTYWDYTSAIYVNPITLGGRLPSADNPIHKNITIEGNTFYMDSDAVVKAASVENLSIKNNKILRMNPDIEITLASDSQSMNPGDSLKLSTDVSGSVNTKTLNRSNTIPGVYEFTACKNVVIEGNTYDDGLIKTAYYENMPQSNIVNSDEEISLVTSKYSTGNVPVLNPAETICYASSDPSVISVDGVGNMTAKVAGTADIYAYYVWDGTVIRSNVIRMTVSGTASPVESVEITSPDVEYAVLQGAGRIVGLKAAVTPSGEAVTWSVSDFLTDGATDVASVSAGGVVTAAKNGIVWATASAGGKSDRIPVIVQLPETEGLGNGFSIVNENKEKYTLADTGITITMQAGDLYQNYNSNNVKNMVLYTIPSSISKTDMRTVVKVDGLPVKENGQWDTASFVLHKDDDNYITIGKKSHFDGFATVTEQNAAASETGESGRNNNSVTSAYLGFEVSGDTVKFAYKASGGSWTELPQTAARSIIGDDYRIGFAAWETNPRGNQVTFSDFQIGKASTSTWESLEAADAIVMGKCTSVPPTAGNISLTAQGQKATVTYDYADADSHGEGASRYLWTWQENGTIMTKVTDTAEFTVPAAGKLTCSVYPVDSVGTPGTPGAAEITIAEGSLSGLTSLRINGTELYKEGSRDYEAIIPADITKVELAYTGSVSGMKLNGKAVTGSILSVKDKDVIALTSGSKIYTITIKAAESSDTSLEKISMSDIGFETADFTEEAFWTTKKKSSSIEVTAGENVGGVQVLAGDFRTPITLTKAGNVYSGKVDFSIGQNTYYVQAVGKDGVTIKQYMVIVVYNPDVEISVTDIKVNGKSLAGFDPDVTEYAAELTENEDRIKVEVTTENAVCIRINDMSAAGKVMEADAEEGTNNIQIIVKAADGITKKVYNIEAVVPVQDNTELFELSVDGEEILEKFDADNKVTVNISDDAAGLVIRAKDSQAEIKAVSGKKSKTAKGILKADLNIYRQTPSVEVTVTARDGVTKETYTIDLRKVVWLSDLEWESATIGWDAVQVQKDSAVEGTPIRLVDADGNVVTFEKGIGTHATSVITYNIADKGFTTFTGYTGMDYAKYNGGYNGATFQILADDDLLFDSGAMLNTDPMKAFSVDVANVGTLVIKVLEGENNWSDHADWADAKFLVDFPEYTGPEPVDKTALNKAVHEAGDYVQEDYTAESWKAFAEALKTAEDVLADDEASEAEVTAAVRTLDDAKAGLEKKSIPKLPYMDVKEGDWFYDYVYDVYVKKLLTGLDETTFGPVQDLVRAQFAVIVYRLEGAPEVEFDAEKFPDVTEGQFYSKAVIWAAENGIVTGYSNNGHFGPNDPITREQMAAMMFRYANYKKKDTSGKKSLSSFPDGSSVQVFAAEAMEWCTAEGIISGKGNEPKILDPQGSTSRAECATIISRYTDIK